MCELCGFVSDNKIIKRGFEGAYDMCRKFLRMKAYKLYDFYDKVLEIYEENIPNYNTY